jgi:hypothetical protein
MRVRDRKVSSTAAVCVAALLCMTAAAAVVAQRGGAAQPQVVVGGVQIVKVAAPKDDMFARPFNSENGTTVVLWIRMPAGQGLIDIDEDASVLETFADDKGTDLGGRFGSFPDTFKDGSGGLLDITSTGMPAAGATRLMASGTAVLTVASGSKPQRVANVRLENARTFRLGQATITVDEVETEGEEQRFTLKLARPVMETIKDVRFLGPKGEAVEASPRGRGYMNDAAEMMFSVKTNAKTLTIEFDVWQGRREIKVPFKVQAGVSLGG